MRDMIYCANIDYFRIWQRPQHLALGLARRRKVLYISPPFSITDPITSRFWLSEWKGNYSFLARMKEEAENLYVYSPPLLLPKHINVHTALNSRIVSRMIHKHVVSLGLKNPILWLSNPLHVGMLARYGGDAVVYDVMDAYSYFHPAFTWSRFRAFEDRVITRANAVFLTTTSLAPRGSEESSKLTLLPNAVETRTFDPSRVAGEIDAEVSIISGPRIGFVGYMGRWFDVDAVALAASSHPDWSFILVGPVHTSIERLKGLSNVHLLGTLPYRRLPYILQGLDVCLLPFKEDKLVTHFDPVKIYEYLSMEKPVVAYKSDEMKKFGDLCSLYVTTGEMVAAIEKALTQGESAESRKKKREFADENSWENRLETVEDVLSRFD